MLQHSCFSILVVLYFIFIGLSEQQQLTGGCPERNGRFANVNQCDAYAQCEDGVPSEQLCPDGLLFNTKARFFSYPCQYPIDVDCSGRTAVQPANATADCPHRYGYYKVGDDRQCGQFLNCVDGIAYKFDCPQGLAFNPDTYQCDWPDLVASCNAEAYLGFSCPEENGAFSPDFRLFRSPSDCNKYFLCINGRPRQLSCPEGMGFSDETGSCEDAEQVPGCAFGIGQEPDGRRN